MYLPICRINSWFLCIFRWRRSSYSDRGSSQSISFGLTNLFDCFGNQFIKIGAYTISIKNYKICDRICEIIIIIIIVRIVVVVIIIILIIIIIKIMIIIVITMIIITIIIIKTSIFVSLIIHDTFYAHNNEVLTIPPPPPLHYII